MMKTNYSIFTILGLLLASSLTYGGAVDESTNGANTTVRQSLIVQNVRDTSGDLITTYEVTRQPTYKIPTRSEIDEQMSWSRLWD
jgi:hypothetical protein